MNTSQINKILKRNPITRKTYVGCFAADQIPLVTVYPACMCVNTAPHISEGEHWVAFYIASPCELEYFHSLGVWPPPSYHIVRYLENYSLLLKNSDDTVPLQDPFAEACGAHVCFFLYSRCKGRSFWSIVDKLKRLGQRMADRYVYAQLKNTIFNI